jgi:hypothetical protein
MPRSLIILLVVLFQTQIISAQRYSTRDGLAEFYSHAPLEDIRAQNKKVQCLLNAETGDVAFRIRIADFQFRKKLMQEHFNEKYMESEKYPEATFTGTLGEFSTSATAPQQVVAKGKLTIHGITHEVAIPGTVTFSAAGVRMNSKFTVKLDDYKITIPQILWQNIAEEIEVTIDVKCKKN